MLQRLATAVLSNQRIPAASASSLFEPRKSYLIDPRVVSTQLGEFDKYKEAIDYAMAIKSAADNRQLDLGSLELDKIFNQLGIPTNLAGVRKRPTVHVPLSDDAYYKIQSKAPKSGTALPTDVEFIKLTNTPMMDWDLPGPSHDDRNVSVRSLGDVEELAREYIARNPQSLLKLYSTPGGYRAWELGETFNTQQFQPRFDQLNVDPDYQRISLDPLTLQNYSEPAGFNSRISHKPGRVDWVAQPLSTFKGAEAAVNPRNMQLVQTLHDLPIEQHYLTQGGVSPDAMVRLQEEIPSASKALQDELKRRFKL